MHAVTDAIASLPPVAAYAIIAALVFGEAAVFIGFVLPGETAVVLGGFLASTAQLNLLTLCVLVCVAAVVGDSVGYEVGKRFGPRLTAATALARQHDRLDQARGLLRDRGGPAVLLGRFTAFFRAVMPGLAGLSEMRYQSFLMWNALGGVVWGVGFSLLGYFAGTSYERVTRDVGRGVAALAAAAVVTLLVWWALRRRRAEQASALHD
jgi:membrane protein DedA with SNARE-associated domain